MYNIIVLSHNNNTQDQQALTSHYDYLLLLETCWSAENLSFSLPNVFVIFQIKKYFSGVNFVWEEEEVLKSAQR